MLGMLDHICNPNILKVQVGGETLSQKKLPILGSHKHLVHDVRESVALKCLLYFQSRNGTELRYSEMKEYMRCLRGLWLCWGIDDGLFANENMRR